MKNSSWVFLGTILLFLSCSPSENTPMEVEQEEEMEEVFEEVATAPVLSTVEVTEITNYVARSGGTITSDGDSPVSQKGVCWSTEQNPSLANNFTEEGGGGEEFTSLMEDLNDNTTYYVRAYATNEIGTSYGDELSFTTEETPIVVFDGDVTLTSQAEVDEFGENGYTIVTGSFAVVSSDSFLTDITNLDGLKQLTEVGSDFFIGSSRMENLDALSNLKSVGGYITILGNSNLSSIDILNEMTEIKSDVLITNNPVTEIIGFRNVTSIDGDLELRQMDALVTISGFNKLNTINGLFRFQSLISISDFSGFSALSSVGGGLDIFGSSITDLDAFGSLSSIGGSISLRGNVFLENIDGLSNLITIGGDLNLDSNSSALNDNFTDGLKNLDGFVNLESVGGEVSIRSNKLLTDLCGLKTLITNGFTGNYIISSNGYNPTQEQLLTDECSN
jgi:hypothetical protein